MILCREEEEEEAAESASSLMSMNGPTPLSVLLLSCGGGRDSRTGGWFTVCTRAAGG